MIGARAVVKPKVDLRKTHRVKGILRKYGLHTVCEESFCPNISECFGDAHTATFLLMGRFCTRHCSFCGIGTRRNPPPPDPAEPVRLKMAVAEMGLRFVVLTSVSRDDLPDYGASHIASCISAVKEVGCGVEILCPDLRYDLEKVEVVLSSRPDVFSHNIETVERLYPKVRPWGDFKRSIEILRYAKSKGFITKTSFIVGLGETYEELIEAVETVWRESRCDIITVGQYYQPTKLRNQEVAVQFDRWEELEKHISSLGAFAAVGPNVRSSYLADRIFNEYLNRRSSFG